MEKQLVKLFCRRTSTRNNTLLVDGRDPNILCWGKNKVGTKSQHH